MGTAVGVAERPRRPRTALAGNETVDELGKKTFGDAECHLDCCCGEVGTDTS